MPLLRLWLAVEAKIGTILALIFCCVANQTPFLKTWKRSSKKTTTENPLEKICEK